VSHLGERISALVDGELDHDERDRALAHLATCGQCRAEADAQRRLKQRLRSLGDTAPAAGLLTRLYAMGEPGGPIPPRARPMPGAVKPAVTSRPRAQRPSGGRLGGRPVDNRPTGRSGAGLGRRLPKARYLALGAATVAVLGVGTAGFVAGADPAQQLPRVGPALEQFAVEHALTSGDVPVADQHPAKETSPKP
jgi:anti-sigma factor RsiW